MPTPQERLQQEITKLIPDVPLDVFHFDFDRDKTTLYLKSNPDLPFIVRGSSQEGYLGLSVREEDGSHTNRLIKLDEKTKQFLTYRTFPDGNIYEDITLSNYINDYWTKHQTNKQLAKEKELQHKIQEEITKLAPGLPSEDIFHFDFNRNQAETYLEENPSIPFVIRKSSQKGYFSVSYRHSEGKVHNLLIALGTDKKTFSIFSQDKSSKEERFVESEILSSSIKNILEQHENQQNQQNQAKNVVVMSIQTLDKEKVALSADKLEAFAKDKPGLKKTGDGHTGFAMAKALGAPFVVLRSKENREETNTLIKDHLVDNGLLILTGHGSQDGGAISGNYVTKEELDAMAAFNTQTERGPADIVSSAMDGGLKSGNHINILLSICYGAADTQKTGNSFAHKLAREFAKQGISTTIIASDTPVLRFGSEKIMGGKITFGSAIGINPKNCFVFNTKVASPIENPIIEISSFNHPIQLSKAGMQFIDPLQPGLKISLPTMTTTKKVESVSVTVSTPPQQPLQIGAQETPEPLKVKVLSAKVTEKSVPQPPLQPEPIQKDLSHVYAQCVGEKDIVQIPQELRDTVKVNEIEKYIERLKIERQKCVILLQNIVQNLSVPPQDPVMNTFLETNSKKISGTKNTNYLDQIKTTLSNINIDPRQVDGIKETIDRLHKGATSKLALGKKAKAEAIEKALKEIPIEERGSAFENLKVREELARHRHLFKRGTVYKKEGKLDEDSAADSFKKLKKQFEPIRKGSIEKSVDDEEQATNAP
jgi:hypothetical protein